jgi:hypothetical protein
VSNRKKTAAPRKPTHHLPKVGTPADDAYRQRRGREDLLDFGLARPRGGVLGWVLGAGALVLLVLGVIALIALT